MSEHDPLCPGTGPTAPFPFPVCVCAIITQVRADERERIARAIGMQAYGMRTEACVKAYERAARIARGGGGQ